MFKPTSPSFSFLSFPFPEWSRPINIQSRWPSPNLLPLLMKNTSTSAVSSSIYFHAMPLSFFFIIIKARRPIEMSKPVFLSHGPYFFFPESNPLPILTHEHTLHSNHLSCFHAYIPFHAQNASCFAHHTTHHEKE